jgi:hypothetical protein
VKSPCWLDCTNEQFQSELEWIVNNLKNCVKSIRDITDDFDETIKTADIHDMQVRLRIANDETAHSLGWLNQAIELNCKTCEKLKQNDGE